MNLTLHLVLVARTCKRLNRYGDSTDLHFRFLVDSDLNFSDAALLEGITLVREGGGGLVMRDGQQVASIEVLPDFTHVNYTFTLSGPRRKL